MQYPPHYRHTNRTTGDVITADIRSVRSSDREQWEPLWQGYLRFYDTSLPAGVTESTWSRITGGDPAMGCLVAEMDEHVVGFLHWVTHPTTWTTTPACYLEDLYVAEPARGAGVGHALIARLTDIGREMGWSGIHWITAQDNAAGMRLYDRVADRTTWVRYEIDLAT